MQKKSIVLFSGGLDSTTCLAVSKAEGFDTYALSFKYGQKHAVELKFAVKIAAAYGVVEHQILELPNTAFVGSSLTDPSRDIPDYSESNEIPSTYVPARNTIFLSYALGYAEVIGANDIFIGANAVDYSGYPDCRQEYLSAFETLAQLATKAGAEGEMFHIHAPLINLKKAEIIQLGTRLGVDYQQTVSCYRADQLGGACGSCDSCKYRAKGFNEAGLQDPTMYQCS